MDDLFSEEQRLFRDAIRHFCERNITRDYVRKCDEEHSPPRVVFEKIAAQGWLGINTPEEYGGQGAGAAETAILLEEVGRHFLDLSFWIFRLVTYGGHAISAAGTQEHAEISAWLKKHPKP